MTEQRRNGILLVAAAVVVIVAMVGAGAVVRWSGLDLDLGPAAPPTSVAANEPDRQRWFFAEGVSTPPFRTTYAILNPGSQTADVNVTLYSDNGQRAQRMVRVAPGAQVRVPGDSILPNAVFGAEIYSTLPVYVERLTTGARDGTTSPGLQRAVDWYVADAQAGGNYETRCVIFNPDQAAATVTVTFLPVSGRGGQQTFAIAAGSRRSIPISQYVPAGPLAMIVHSSVPIVAELVTHFDAGNAMYEGHGIAPGQLSKTWYVALANTQTGFSARVAVFNPGNSPANVRMTVIENKIRKTVPFAHVPPQSKRDVDVNSVSGNARVTVQIESDQAIAVQSTGAYTSAGDGGAVAAFSALAASAPAKVWYFPETVGDDDYDSYISLFNPLENAARATVTYIVEDGESLAKPYRVGTRERLTLAVRAEANGLAATGAARRVVAVIIKSDRLIVADRLTMFRRTVGASASAGIAGR